MPWQESQLNTKETFISGLLLLIPIAFLVLFFYLPLALILGHSLGEEGSNDIIQIITSDYYREILFFTLFQAALSTLASLLLALPGAYFLSHFQFPGKTLIRSLTKLPFVLPSILVVLGFVVFFGSQGALNSFLTSLGLGKITVLYSLFAIVLAHAFYNFPIAMSIISDVWEKIDVRSEKAAMSLGASPFRVFREITLPQLLPGIATSGALIFLFCFMSFTIVLVLGGGPQYNTVEVEVFNLIRHLGDFSKAGALALVSSIISLLLLYGYIKTQNQNNHAPVALGRPIPPHKVPWVMKILLGVYFLLVGTLIFGPLLSVVFRSFTPRIGPARAREFSFEAFIRILEQGSLALNSITNSFRFAFSSLSFTLPLGVLSALALSRVKGMVSRILETLIMLPMGLSALYLGLGYTRLLGVLPWGRNAAELLIPLSHGVIAFPFVLRSIKAVVDKYDQRMNQAARSLGASHWRVFLDIQLPLILGGILTGAAFSFALSLGEIQATIILSDGQIPTIPLAIYRLIGSYDFGGASALGVILLTLCLVVFVAVDSLHQRNNHAN